MMYSTEKQNMINRIISIMKDRLSFNFDFEMKDIEHQLLFGAKFNLEPYELGYLLIEVEKEFNISISENDLLNPGIRTINDFIKIINKE